MSTSHIKTPGKLQHAFTFTADTTPAAPTTPPVSLARQHACGSVHVPLVLPTTVEHMGTQLQPTGSSNRPQQYTLKGRHIAASIIACETPRVLPLDTSDMAERSASLSVM
jgi:hypothetical protein